MGLLIYIAISVAGILALYALNRAVVSTQPAILTSPGMALEALNRDFPAVHIHNGTILLSADGRAALLATSEPDKTGLVVAHGDKFVTRLLRPGDIQNAHGLKIGEKTSLHLIMEDPTLPRAEFHMAGQEAGAEHDIDYWLRRFSDITPVMDERA